MAADEWNETIEDCRRNTGDDCGQCEGGCPGSPIVIDLDHNGFAFGGVEEGEDPVLFDLDADGVVEFVGWTAPGSGDAFLALDRNGNGRVDDGGELFGNWTRLLNGLPAPNGFYALAELDSPLLGGNGDGVLDHSDEVFGSLWIWVDENRNGFSEHRELRVLDEVGVVWIETEYRLSQSRDRHGNQLGMESFAAQLRPVGNPRKLRVVDVVFRVIW